MELKIFLIGIVAGMVGGALITANSYSARKIVKENQDKVCKKAEELAKKCKDKQSKSSEESEE